MGGEGGAPGETRLCCPAPVTEMAAAKKCLRVGPNPGCFVEIIVANLIPESPSKQRVSEKCQSEMNIDKEATIVSTG